MVFAKKLPVFLFSLLVLASCEKQDDILPNPVPESSLSRKLSFPNQGNLVKEANYEQGSIITARAFRENGLLYIFLDALGQGKAGDGLLLGIDAANLQTGPVKTYRFSGTSLLIKHARYTYSYTYPSGDTWGSFTDSKVGVQFEGELTITGYDAVRGLISGSFSVKAPDLITDPTRESIGEPIDPKNYCTLEVSGQFRHLKIQ